MRACFGVQLIVRFSPRRRITVEQSLDHPYLEPYHDPNDEPGARPLKPEFFDLPWENDEQGREMLKRQCFGCSEEIGLTSRLGFRRDSEPYFGRSAFLIRAITGEGRECEATYSRDQIAGPTPYHDDSISIEMHAMLWMQ